MSCDKGGKKDDSASSGEPATDSGSENSDTNTATSAEAGTVALDTVNKIVALTDPVQAYPIADVSAEAVAARTFDNVALETALLDGASKGILFGKTVDEIKTAFGSTGSKPYCETVNSGMKFFKEVSAADFHLCILKTVAAKGQAIKSGVHQTWDFKIGTPDGSMTYRMKFKIEPDPAGGIQSFENFTCEARGSASATQTGYIKQSVADGVLTVHGRTQGEGGEGDKFKSRVDMSARLGSDQRPIGVKTIDYADEGDGGKRSVHFKVKQGAANLEAVGYEAGDSGEIQHLRFVELLDENSEQGLYAITKLGYGSGAELTRQGSDAGASTESFGWNGDDLKANQDEPRVAKVSGRAAEFLSKVGDKLDVDLVAEETYDCADEPEYVFEGTMEDFSSCIEAYDIDQNGSSMCSDIPD